MPELMPRRPGQLAALRWIGKRGGVAMLNMPMSAGKSRVVIDWIQINDIYRVLILCPKSAVEDVWPEQFQKHAEWPEDYEVVPLVKGTVKRRTEWAHWKMSAPEYLEITRVFVINYQAAFREPFRSWALQQPWDLVVLDECHPAGTMISTPKGLKAIESLQEGDEVWGVDHATGNAVPSIVKATSQRSTDEPLVQIGNTRMTPEHPVWTPTGYKTAKSIEKFDAVCYIDSYAKTHIQNLRAMPEALSGYSKEAILRSLLRNEDSAFYPQSSSEKSPYDAKTDETSRYTTKDTEALILSLQSFSQSRDTSQGRCCESAERIFYAYRRERPSRTEASTIVSQLTRVAGRGGHSDQASSQKDECSELLQDRHRQYCAESWSRGRWIQSQHGGYKEKRQEERNSSPKIRLAYPPIHQQRSLGRSGFVRQERPYLVYNLTTTTGNFFAEGLLVHNSHRIKAPGGKQSWFCKALGKIAKARLCLTGTPMPHSPLDIYAQFRFLEPRVFGTRVDEFKARYCYVGGFSGRQIIGWHLLEDLRRRYRTLAFESSEAELGLPPEQDIVRTCELEPKARKHYDELKKEFITQTEQGVVTASNALVKLLRFQQITAGFFQHQAHPKAPKVVEAISRAKTELLLDILEDLPLDEPVVIFALFHPEIDRIKNACTKAKRPIYELSGRCNELAAWKSGKRPILVVQIQSGAESIDLTRARYGIYHSLGYSNGNYKQSRRRIRRTNQQHPVTYIHLLCRNTVDQQVRRALARNQKPVDLVLKEGLE